MIKKYQSTIILILASALLIGGLSYWSGMATKTNDTEVQLEETDNDMTSPLTAEEQTITQPAITNTMNPIAVLQTNKGTIEVELFADTMPITAGNFAKLINEGFYDGIKFHRVINGFMIQSGDPLTKLADTSRYGTGGPGYAIADEHIKGDLLTNTRGTLSMANSGPNSGGSQFFINLVDNTNLDFDKQPLSSKHPVFGRIVAGMDIVDAIGVAPTNERDLPVEAIVIEKATIKAAPDA